MSFAVFSIIGYASVLLWLVALMLFLLHFKRKPRRWLCHYAVAIMVVAYVLALINSRTYVNRIQVDQSEAIAAAQARQEEARHKAENERSGDVAQIRFAEDDRDDFLDMGGLDDADRKYIESMTEESEPAWKRQKKTRSNASPDDDSLEDQLDTTEKAGGVENDELAGDGDEAVILPEKLKMLANRLDEFNLKLIRLLLLGGICGIAIDYLQRANRFDEAYFPLPLPSMWVNGLTPLPSIMSLPTTHKRSLLEELQWLVRRGDTFVYLTATPERAASIPEDLPRLPKGKRPFNVLHVKDDDPLVDDKFVFEGLWYNRAAFVVESASRAEKLITSICEFVGERLQTRAHTRQSVHIVWDLDVAIDDMLHEDVVRQIANAGISLHEVRQIRK